jgi:DNA (cytosine-5)-methyltransferase 1
MYRNIPIATHRNLWQNRQVRGDSITSIVRPSVLDLFCGGGGFGLGAELAGFHSALAIDVDPDLQATYKLNFPYTKAIEGDIGALDRDSWRVLIEGVRPTVVVGGPPCQGFSRIGKRDRSDPRNSLIGHYFRHIDILRPKAFVMENVEGLLDEGNREQLDAGIEMLSGKYSIVGPITVNALDFGAPTARRRVVIVGYDPNEMSELSINELRISATRRVTVEDAISDLPGPLPSPSPPGDWGWGRLSVINPGEAEISDYAREMRGMPPIGLGWSVAVERLAEGMVSGLMPTLHTETVRARFGTTEPGKVEDVSRYPRLAWKGHCPTLRAGTGKEKGSFQSMRPIHPAEPRVITVREAARLQGFPDWFAFGPTKWHSFRVIGNSVSPKVSKGILSLIKSKLGYSEPSNQGFG